MQIQGMKLMFYRPLSVHCVIQMNAERYMALNKIFGA